MARCAALAALAVTVSVAGPAMVAGNLVTNGSFETYDSGTSTFVGWTNSGTIGVTPPQYATQQLTDGKTAGQYGDVVNADPFTNSPDAAGTHAAYFVADEANQSLSQTISLIIGQVYEVGFDLYKNASGASNAGSFTISGKITPNGAGATTTVTTASSASLPTATWTHYAARFIATTSSAVFVFNYVSGTAPAADVLADLVYVKAIPEPASLALLGAGLAGLGLARRRRAF